MKTYTVFFTDSWMSGSHMQTIADVTYITTDNLDKALEADPRIGDVICVLLGRHEDCRG